MTSRFNQHITSTTHPMLSICIATYNRGKYIGETLDSILCQILPCVEIVVVDGASPDNTSEVMAQYLSLYPGIKYFREQENSGVDRDYDKAVGYSSGEYCWLMTDDDLARVNSVARILDSLDSNPNLVVVNAEVKSPDFSTILDSNILKYSNDLNYSEADRNSIFIQLSNYLSFIGSVVIKRQLWLARDRFSYYGTLFIHVGVIFQNPPITNVGVIIEPLIVIRYGNAMWTARSFEIWMFKWPELIWSFSCFSDDVKLKVCMREPWRSTGRLLYYRALGAFKTGDFRNYLPNDIGIIANLRFYFTCLVPHSIANFVMTIYISVFSRESRLKLYDLVHSSHSTLLSRFISRISGINY